MAKNSPDYDDRNFRMLKTLIPNGDIRDLVLQKQTREPLHTSISLRSHTDLAENYRLNEELCLPTPTEIWLFDDILTKGTHFRAAHDFLKGAFPQTRIAGFFIARAIQLQMNT